MAQITAISTALLEKNELTWQAPFLAPRGHGTTPVGLAAPPLTSWASPMPVTVLSRACAAPGTGGGASVQVLADQQVELVFGALRDELGRRVDGELHRVTAGTVAVLVERRDDARDDGLCGLDVAAHVAQHLLERHILLPFVPHVVVGDHGHSSVTELCLTGQLGLLKVGHADDVEAQLTIDVALGARGELGTLDADVGAALVDRGAGGATVLHEQPADVGAEGIGEAHVHNDAVAEEGARPHLGTVVELVGHDHVERLELFAQAADGAGGQHVVHPQRLHAPDVGAVVDLAGKDAVPARVSGKKSDRHAVDIAEEVGVAGRPEGRVDGDFASVLEQLVEAGSTDDTDLGRILDSGHRTPPSDHAPREVYRMRTVHKPVTDASTMRMQ